MPKYNYLEEIAQKIRHIADPESKQGTDYDSLYRHYAVLALAKGTKTTHEDVHNAWSAWAIEHSPYNKFIVPYNELPEFVQEYDFPFTEAIHRVAHKAA